MDKKELIEAVNETVDSHIKEALKHREKIKVKRYKSDRALLMAATSNYHWALSIKAVWQPLQALLEEEAEELNPGHNGTRP
jgi:hypothetical protein